MRPMRLIAIFVVCLAMHWSARSASAQGTAPYLPEPISTIRLHRLLDPAVQPDDAHWPAIEKVHDAYLASFAALRDERLGRIARDAARNRAAMDSRCVGEVRVAASAIASLDEQLFAALREILGEAASRGIAVAAERRTVERLRTTWGHQTGLSFSGLGALADTVRRAVRDRATLAAINDSLDAYDAKAASLLRRIVEKSLAATEEGARATREAKLVYDEQDPAGARQYWEVFSAASRAKWNDALDIKRELREFERATRRALLAKLSFDQRRRAHAALEDVMDPWGQLTGYRIVELPYRMALSAPELNAEEKAAVLAEYQLWAEKYERLADQAAALDPDDRAADAERETIRRARQQLDSEQQRILFAGPGRVVADRWMNASVGRDLDAIDPFTDDFASLPRGKPYDHSARWSPRPVAMERLDSLADRLSLPEDQRVVIHDLHAKYSARWNEVMAVPINSVVTNEAAMRQVDGNVIRTLRERVDAVAAARVAVLDAAAHADDTLYEDLAAVLGPDSRDEIELSHLGRALECLGTGDWAMYLPVVVIVRPVDPVAVLDGLGLSPDVRGPAVKGLLRRRDDLIARARDRAVVQASLGDTIQSAFDASFALQREAQAKAEAKPGEGEKPAEEPQANDDAQRAVAESWNAAERMTRDGAAARLAVDRAMRAVFDQAIAHMDAATRRQADLAYERRAVPEFFDDPRAPWSLLDAAARLDTLDDAQRLALVALRDATEEAHARFAVAAGTLRRSEPPNAQREWREVTSARNIEEGRLRFARDERSVRAVTALRRLLSAEERALIPKLDDYEQRVELVKSRFIRFAE